MMLTSVTTIIAILVFVFVFESVTIGAFDAKSSLRKGHAATRDLKVASAAATKYEQYGCTSYYNTGYAYRPPNTKYDSFTAETCSEACKDKGFEYFGFECPMTNQVHCQCYKADTIGEKPVEEAVCKERVGKDGDKHCTGPAMMDGLSLGGADMGSIYKVGAIDDEKDTNMNTVTPIETIENGDDCIETFVQHGCTSYYNTGYAYRPRNTRYNGFTAQTCRDACKDKGFEYFGFECPMTDQVHCQCYKTDTIGEKPVEEAVCKERVGRDGDKHCTGPAMMDGLSLGGADMGSIYEVDSRTTCRDPEESISATLEPTDVSSSSASEFDWYTSEYTHRPTLDDYDCTKTFVQHGCTSYYNTGYAYRPPNTKYDSFTVETCSEACKDKGFEYFGFECPMTDQVHCQCYKANKIGKKPVEEAVCKERVGRDGDKHCTGPAMMDGLSLGGADMGSIYEVDSRTTCRDPEESISTTIEPTDTELDCIKIAPTPIWKEIIGNPSEEYSNLKHAVQITNSKRSDSVTFTVSQLWLEQGAPMVAVYYPGGQNGEKVCDMEATSNDGTFIEYGTTKEYTAECTYGYADIGIYVYVGSMDKFNIEECESCSAPNMDYIGHYLTLPCVSVCEELPTIEEATEMPSDLAPPCPEDIVLLRKMGSTDFPVNEAVKIVRQETETVTVELNQAWTSTTAIDQIYISYKDTIFDRHCFEQNNVENGVYDSVTIMCNILSPKAYLEICVVDDLANEVLTVNDRATVPKCCHSEFAKDTPVVCYSLEINCFTECIDESQQRKLTSLRQRISN